jgi:hypothetical protein
LADSGGNEEQLQPALRTSTYAPRMGGKDSDARDGRLEARAEQWQH